MKRGYFNVEVSEYFKSTFVILFRNASDDVCDDVRAFRRAAVIDSPFSYFHPKRKAEPIKYPLYLIDRLVPKSVDLE